MPGALDAYQQSLAIRRTLAATDKDNAELKRDMAASLNGIGDALLNAGDKEKALAAYEEGVALVRDLVEVDTTNLLWQRDLSISLNRVGDVKRDSGDSAGRVREL